MKKTIVLSLMFALFVGIAIPGCKDLGKIYQAIQNMERLKFKLEGVNSYRLMGINISKKKSVSDISVTDGMKLLQAFNSKQFPVEFVLDVAVMNPNDDGTSKKKSNRVSNTNLTLTKLEWRLLIDDVTTINGIMDNSVSVPSKGEAVTVPIAMKLDLYDFFKNKGYDGIINLAMAMGGANSDPARVKLDVKPTVMSAIGQITYPGRITVIDKEWRD